jgi:hypothetical protein
MTLPKTESFLKVNTFSNAKGLKSDYLQLQISRKGLPENRIPVIV